MVATESRRTSGCRSARTCNCRRQGASGPGGTSLPFTSPASIPATRTVDLADFRARVKSRRRDPRGDRPDAPVGLGNIGQARKARLEYEPAVVRASTQLACQVDRHARAHRMTVDHALARIGLASHQLDPRRMRIGIDRGL